MITCMRVCVRRIFEERRTRIRQTKPRTRIKLETRRRRTRTGPMEKNLFKVFHPRCIFEFDNNFHNTKIWNTRNLSFPKEPYATKLESVIAAGEVRKRIDNERRWRHYTKRTKKERRRGLPSDREEERRRNSETPSPTSLPC
ncbi:uncharacterized protein LOC105207516 [Solenopsis invicta]|uniref:uncharacterized protein LOC105207516 n=1 Tax=Solenopsis invicta TaxID=13686 RepID=UPI000595D0BD|nr:uncharacterized protein LOC105207516 [Solenopsis invicta]